MQTGIKIKSWQVITALVINLLFFKAVAPAAIQWGVNIHDGGSDPQILAERLAERNLKRVRMDLWGTDPVYLSKFKKAAAILNAEGIQIEAIVFTIFSAGQSRSQDINADLTEVEQTVYNSTKPQIESTQNLVQDYELQNEVSLYQDIKVSGSTGQNANDYNVPCGRLQAAVLRGMSRAIDDVRQESRLPLRIILGTTDRSYGFLTFMQQQGVLFDIVGYHIYPWEQHSALDQDTWFGKGGPLGQLAVFNKPITINEFNAGEIYSGTGGYSSLADYENQAGRGITEKGFRSVDKHLKEIVNQTVANVEAVIFYEAWDEPRKAEPENRFGLYYDAPDFNQPKITLLLAACYAGGKLSQAEQDSLSKRKLGQCSGTGVTEGESNDTPGFQEQNDDAGLNSGYQLYQNYPNPFNSTTQISYRLPFSGFVTLKIYDIQGKEIVVAVNEVQAAGNHQVQISANNLAGGIYFYSLNQGAYFQVKKFAYTK